MKGEILMKKLVYLIVLIVTLGLIVAGCLPTVPPTEQGELGNLEIVNVSKSEVTPIVIDGILSPGEWDDYFWFTDNDGNDFFGVYPEFTYYKTNDSDYLYFATIVDDPTPLENANDDIWLAFRDAEDNYKEFRKGFTLDPIEWGKYSEEPFTSSYSPLPVGVEFGCSIDDSHIYYEWKIPLTLINVEPGETIKYLTHVREYPKPEGISSPINYHPEVTIYFTYSDGEQFGDLTLDIEEIEIAIDIKPQSCPNPLNVKSKGVLPVAILGTENFDVTEIDPESVLLEGTPPIRCALEDVGASYKPIDKTDCYDCSTAGPDEILDLILHFNTQEIILALGDIEDGACIALTLTGNLLDGTPIEGKGLVLILNKIKPEK